MKLGWFKIFPYLLFEKKLHGKNGSSKMFWISVDPDAPKTTLAHEEVHVMFWWATTIIVAFSLMFVTGIPLILALGAGAIVDPLLGTFFKPYKRFEESFAYARAATLKPDPELYLDALDKSRLHLDKYGEGFASLVRKRMKWWE